MSNRPISVVEVERRRLSTAASLSKDLEVITAWGLKNMYPVLYAIKQEVSKRALDSSEHPGSAKKSLFKLLGLSITENMIWHEHVSPIATAAGKCSDIYSEPGSTSHHPTFSCKAQIRPSLEYCSHIWELLPLLPCLYLMQSKEGQIDSTVTRP
nr:unnamed protein product [Callosobruchus chinensis]